MDMKQICVFVDLEHGIRMGVTRHDPPFTGGDIIDRFEAPEGASQKELRAEAERRNGPLRMVYAIGGAGESYRANRSGLDEAMMYGFALARDGKRGGHRIVTSRGVVIKHWEATAAAPS
jgi:hypothetical protein